MKPWPAILAKLHPLPITRWAEYPWWRTRPMLIFGGPVHANATGLLERNDDLLSVASTPADTQRRAVVLDTAQPLPFPGLRTGQTWAVDVTETSAHVFTITEYDEDHVDAEPVGPHVLHVTLIPRPWHAGGSWITDTELRALCQDGYLLADQTCPHLAPWAGVAQ